MEAVVEKMITGKITKERKVTQGVALRRTLK
jgi:hypothetical protein